MSQPTPPEFPGGRTLHQALTAPRENRRDFLKLMGFGLSAAAVAGCTRIPERRAVPLVDEPEQLLPGVASWYATACGGCAAGCGLLVKVRDGRPIKIEGNPDSPVSRGGTCATGQATVLALYDEGRLRGPLWLGRPASWETIDAAVAARLAAVQAAGQSVVVLTGPGLGPAGRSLLADWLAAMSGPAAKGGAGGARHVVWEPLSLAAVRRANGRSFGLPVVPRFLLERARLIVGLEADFLGTWLSPVELTRAYATARRAGPEMARHVQIESGFSLTGANADHRLPLRPSELGLAAVALLAGVARLAGQSAPALPAAAGFDPALVAALAALAAELWRHRGASLVLCGEDDPDLQLVVNRINHLLGNVGRTLDLDRPSFQSEGDGAEMAALIEEMERGEVGALFLWGVNPGYDHPQAGRFLAALERVALTVSFADRIDETAAHVHAVCPDHHFLESWGDAEPVAGARHLRQPAIAPLHDTRAAEESLLCWRPLPTWPALWRDGLREHWRRAVFAPQAQDPVADFDTFWDRALERGGVFTAPEPAQPHPDRTPPEELAAAAETLAARATAARQALAAGACELRLFPAHALRDGRHANNPWLQELPDPITRVSWGNVAQIGPALAARLGLADGDVVRLAAPAGTAVELSALVQPGLADGVVAVALGHGRTRAGKAGDGVGVDLFPFVRLADGLPRLAAAGIRLTATGRQAPPARVQLHDRQEGRPLVREIALGDLTGEAHAADHSAAHPSLWAEHPPAGHSWGMAIDLSACTGCAACVVACQAENNVAVVGPDEVRRGREMHWLRIDRYYSETSKTAETALFQPMLCQHCSHAPCETVCPVLATVHSSDGLNQQVYNRCVGTRYCANNCPYKVRRFNWFDYAENERFDYHMNSDLGRLVLNPDVVVRSRGVMEKCSLCIQRIQDGKLEADRRGEPTARFFDRAVKTACQQACPAEAITFGDRLDPASAVSRRQADRRFYRVLDELGTRPAVGYLAKVRNRPGAAAAKEA